MSRALREYGKFVAVILAFAIASAVCGAYIVSQQHLRTPFQNRYELRVEMPSAESLTSGLNQPVNVAGVRVGDVVNTELRNGRALVKLSIDRGQLPAVYADGHASLVPRTPLKDMQIELYPGRRAAGKVPEGGVLRSASNTIPIDSDELSAALDADTRAYFTALVSAASRGMAGRGRDLRSALRALGPTTEQLRRITGLLAARRSALGRLVHNLSTLSVAAAGRDRELAQVVDAGSATLRAVASQDAALRESVALLPGVLRRARGTLTDATPFAEAIPPTLAALTPTARRLPAALRAAGPLANVAEPFIRTQVRPLVREAGPLVDDLGVTVSNLSRLSPHLVAAFKVFDYVANELAYNPPGDDEGFLFWTAWFAHNANSALSTEDAHGTVIRGLALVSCSTATSQPDLGQILQFLTATTPNCPH